MFTVWLLFGKPDLSMTMNGALAGLVAITAPCAYVSGNAAILIGAVGGVIVVLGVSLLDSIGVDDPVGAVPVHGMNGLWGTLSVGIWGQHALGLARDGLVHGGGLTQLGVQALGVSGRLALRDGEHGPGVPGLQEDGRAAGHRARRSCAGWISASTAWRHTPASRSSSTHLTKERTDETRSSLIYSRRSSTTCKAALFAAEVLKFSVTNALGCGQQKGYH